MKILHVNTNDLKGGAAIAAYRLHKGLTGIQVDSRMLVQIKSSDDDSILLPKEKYSSIKHQIRKKIDEYPLRKYRNKTNYFSISKVRNEQILKAINNSDADIVHLHWICNSLLKIEDIKRINKPLVWTLHDMWALTGGCHYDQECGAYKSKCGLCPVLKSEKTNDISTKVFIRKKETYEQLDICIVGISRWMIECVKNSILLSDKRIVYLPNPIDTQVFKPIKKDIAKEILGVDHKKKLVLFGAINSTSDPRKGFKELKKSLSQIDPNISFDLAIFGSNKSITVDIKDRKVHNLGKYNDELSLQIVYSAADVMLVPSLQEAFGQTVTESMSCGTPVVGFEKTGVADIIDHKCNGYLAKPYDTNDLANGISWVLNNPNIKELSNNARRKIMKEYELNTVAEKYRQLYYNILYE